VSQPARSRPAALAGVYVLELGRGVSAPWCTRLLAGLGAEVVKLEPPDGDPARAWGTPPDAAAGATGALFAWLNAGKRSVRLAGDTARDAALVDELAARADVVVTNLDAGERARLGLTESRLAGAGRDAVVLALSPYGDAGPWADAPGESITVCAAGGMSVILGEPGRTPLSFPYDLPAMQAGLHGAAAVLTALLARRRTRRGQRIDVAEADVMAFLAGGMSLFVLGGGGKWERRGFERHGGIYPSGFYPCKDGFVFLATQSRAQWTAFLRLMGDPPWAAADPALRDGVAIGWRRADEVDLHFIPWLTERTRAELVELSAREPDIVLGPINDVRDVLAAAQLEARGFWERVELGERTLRMPGFGCTMATPWRSGPVPQLGEASTADVFAPRAPAPRPAASTSRDPRRPLAGYRAVEFGWNWAGPLVGQLLADMGVEVIKVETPGRLDFMRHWPHARAFFHNANRGKLSVSLDMKDAAGRALLRRLVGVADIVFDNFSAGVMDKNGFGYEALCAVKPDVIVMSMAMAGQTGPLRHLRGFATMATGFAGLEAAIGYPDLGPSGLPAIGIGDANAAIQGVVALLAALWHRERTGEGQFIDLSQIEAATALMAAPIAEHQLTGRVRPPEANAHDRLAPHGIYPALGTERWIGLAVRDDGEWNALVGVMGAPAWAREASLAHTPERLRRRAEIDARLSAWTATVERDALVERLRGAGLAAAPVLEIDEMNAWPHFRARGLWHDVESFVGGTARVYDTPWRLADTPGGVDRGSPRLGEHDDYVFGTLLGLSGAERSELAGERVIA
jgi:crotonobetainyl-CoA:carnitine CoA-transferase CaiB-like acyl-CoA transferase